MERDVHALDDRPPKKTPSPATKIGLMLARLKMALDKPELAFRPGQLLTRALRSRTAGYRTVRLPWGLPLSIRVGDTVGTAIWLNGVYELALSETLWRLVDANDVVCDIGAHVGYTSALLAARVGSRGRVIAFEPHPRLFEALQGNAALWKRHNEAVSMELVPAAVGKNDGEGLLCVPSAWEQNSGSAFLKETGRPGADAVPTIPVRTINLNRFFARREAPVLLKIDTEGSELAVLAGARGLLQRQEVRDVAFEDFGAVPSPAMQLLERMGYTVLRIERTFLGPRLVDALAPASRSLWEPPNYLATCQPKRAMERMRARGWRVLGGGLR